MCGYPIDIHDKLIPGGITVGKHYTVLVQIKEVTDAQSVVAHGVRPTTTENPRTVHDVLNIATTADTAHAAVLRAVKQLELELESLT